jgi:hypothetical protein
MGTPISQLHLCSQLGFLRRRWHNFTFEKWSILESGSRRFAGKMYILDIW